MGHSDQVKLINLTPHDIVIQAGDADPIVLPSQGVARISTRQVPRGLLPVGGTFIRTAKNGYGEVTPDTGPTAIRDKNGRIVAVTKMLSWE